MEGSPSGISHKSRLSRTLTSFSALIYISVELQNCSFQLTYDCLLNTRPAYSRIGCSIILGTHTSCTSNSITLLWFWRNVQALGTENVLAEASITRFRGFLNLCKLFFNHSVFFCFKCINSLKQDSFLFSLCTRSSCGALGMICMRIFHAGYVVFTCLGTQYSTFSIASKIDGRFFRNKQPV